MLTINLKNIATTDLPIKVSMQGQPFNLLNEIRFEHNMLPNGWLEIHNKFGWNGASIPRVAELKLGSGKNAIHLKCSLPHDFGYMYGRTLGVSRKIWDIIYRDSLRACGVSKLKANIEYWSVRAIGWRYYK